MLNHSEFACNMCNHVSCKQKYIILWQQIININQILSNNISIDYNYYYFLSFNFYYDLFINFVDSLFNTNVLRLTSEHSKLIKYSKVEPIDEIMGALV